MECRSNCGACCIGLSISSTIPGMPNGKAAGVRCIHLEDDMRCSIFFHPDRPKTCANFKAEPLFCGTNRDESLAIFEELENAVR